jgi:hypothetical protein
VGEREFIENGCGREREFIRNGCGREREFIRNKGGGGEREVLLTI